MNLTTFALFRRAAILIASVALFAVALGPRAFAQDTQQQFEADWARIKAQCHLDDNLTENEWEQAGRPCPQATPVAVPLTGDPAVIIGQDLGQLAAVAIECLLGLGPCSSQPRANPAIAQAHALNDQGVTAFQAQHYAEAASYFLQALQMTPDDKVIRNNLSDANDHLRLQTRQAVTRALSALDRPTAPSAQAAPPNVPGLPGFASAGAQTDASGLGFEPSAGVKVPASDSNGLSFDNGSGKTNGNRALTQLQAAALGSHNTGCEFAGGKIEGSPDCRKLDPMLPATPGTIPVPRAAAVFVDGIPANVRVNPLVAPAIKAYENDAHTEGTDQAAFLKAANAAEANPQDKQAQSQAQSEAGKLNTDKKQTADAQATVCGEIGLTGGLDPACTQQ
jgi:hypothetical protein